MVDLGAARTLQGGRYVIERRLGEGGKGVVYQALDTQLDRTVAIKLLKTEGLDEEGFQRFRNEARLASRLTHPNIVSVFDIGVENGEPFQVMELVDGKSLRGLLSDTEGPLPLPRTVEIVHDVARALAYAHGKGVLHRDVKPENILLTLEGVVKLMDFGLARALDRPRLTAPGTMVGTPAYMAPENALGRESDERSDLYSLGAVFYEMATGRPLFSSSDSLKLIFSHIHDQPTVASHVNPRLPPGVDAILIRLLAKSPSDRYASAPDLERALSSLAKEELPGLTGERAVSTGPGGSLPHDQLTPDLRRLTTPDPGHPFAMIGRESDLAAVKEQVDAALRGEGSTILVTGEAGVGKSRVSDEMEAYAQLRGMRVLVGRCHDQEGGAPYAPWTEMIRTLVRDSSPAELTAASGLYVAELARLVPEIAEKVRGPVQSAASDSSDAQRVRMFDGVSHLFVEASRTAPILLEISDLHSADPGSIDLFRHVARAISRHFVLLSATYRDAEVEEGSPLSRVLEDLHHEHLGRTVTLRRLERPAVERMIAAAFGEPVPPDFLNKVYERTAGNPFFVEEVLRSLVEEGVVFRVGDRWERKPITDLRVPSSVRAVVARRLDRLDEETQTVLRIAATLGNEFTFEALVYTSELDESHVVDAIERALRHRLVREQRLAAGRVTYRFLDPQIREVLYDQMSAIRRRRYHRRAATALEDSAGARLDELAGELAHHYLSGGDPAKALEFSVPAARRAARVYAHDEAIRHFESALELMEELRRPEETLSAERERARVGLLRELGLESSFVGRVALSARCYEEAAQISEKLGDRTEAGASWLEAGRCHLWVLNAPERGLKMLLRARDLLETEPESEVHAELYRTLGTVASNSPTSGLPPARGLYERALAIARARSDGPMQVSILGSLLGIDPIENVDAMRAHLREALDLVRTLDSVEAPAILYQAAWTALLLETDVAETARLVEEGVRWSQRTGDLLTEALIKGGPLAFALILTGDLAKASENVTVSNRFFEQIGSSNVIGLQLETQIELMRGNLDRAAQILAAVRHIGEQRAAVPDWVSDVVQTYYEAWLAKERGEIDEASASLGTCLGLLDSKGYPAWGAAIWALMLSHGADLALQSGEPAKIEPRVSRYLNQIERIYRFSPVAPIRAIELRVRGVWAAHRGDAPEAVRYLEDSTLAWRKVPWVYELATTLYELGVAHQQAGDRIKAGKPLDESLEIFTRLQASRDVDRVLARKALLQS